MPRMKDGSFYSKKTIVFVTKRDALCFIDECFHLFVQSITKEYLFNMGFDSSLDGWFLEFFVKSEDFEEIKNDWKLVSHPLTSHQRVIYNCKLEKSDMFGRK